MMGFVTFMKEVDAEFALYRLVDYVYMGRKIKVYPAPVTQQEIERRRKEQNERERRADDFDKRKKVVNKQKKGSLRFLAPRNQPSTDNQNRQQPVQQNNSQRQAQNRGNFQQGQNRNNRGGQNQQQGQNRNNRGGQNQQQGQNRNNNNPNRNPNNNNKKGRKKFQVKTENKTTVPEKNVSNTVVNRNEGPLYEVTIKNLETNSFLGAPLLLNQVELDSFFPPEVREKLVDVRA